MRFLSSVGVLPALDQCPQLGEAAGAPAQKLSDELLWLGLENTHRKKKVCRLVYLHSFILWLPFHLELHLSSLARLYCLHTSALRLNCATVSAHKHMSINPTCQCKAAPLKSAVTVVAHLHLVTFALNEYKCSVTSEHPPRNSVFCKNPIYSSLAV